ncbi:hypothetical protein [Dyadobacter diqingensis]|uniref:hypothetical protein n=1 Tax=Dyadobacter diqingensis TaxID=2938121 RepID=UPI0020C23B67|nr:hypothetical protein [Dyadobacter diqingensis]
MKIDFTNLNDDVIPMNQFRLKYRFVNEDHDKLPEQHLDQLKPLGKKASKFLWDYTVQSNLHANTPFKKDFFKTIDKTRIQEGNEKATKKWLYQRGFAFDKPVFLSWQPTEAMIVPWKLLIKYFDHFYYCTPGDLTVIDQSLNWALLVYHEDEMYFGTNEKYKTGESMAGNFCTW